MANNGSIPRACRSATAGPLAKPVSARTILGRPSVASMPRIVAAKLGASAQATACAVSAVGRGVLFWPHRRPCSLHRPGGRPRLRRPLRPQAGRGALSVSWRRGRRSWCGRWTRCPAALAGTLPCWPGGRPQSCRDRHAGWPQQSEPRCCARSRVRSAASRKCHWHSCRSAPPASNAGDTTACRPAAPPPRTPKAPPAPPRQQHAPNRPPAAKPSGQVAEEKLGCS